MNFEEMKNSKESLLELIKTKYSDLVEEHKYDRKQLADLYIKEMDNNNTYNYIELVQDLNKLNFEQIAEMIQVVLLLDDFAFIRVIKKKNKKETHLFINNIHNKIVEIWGDIETSLKFSVHFLLRTKRLVEELEIDLGK